MPASELPTDPREVTLWYHTLDLPGYTTPGWFDLRPIIDELPWPDVRGKRCLDVGTYDGQLAFELERRGASEVIATDIPNHEDWDWPAAARARGQEGLAALAGPKGHGFEVARAALGSSVQKREINIYDLSPEEMGTFDVVVCGSLMLHLRDPVRALESIRSVCTGWFMSAEEVSLPLTKLFRKWPVADVRFSNDACQWWTVNAAGHKRMVEAAGFEVTQETRVYPERFGIGHNAASVRHRLRHNPTLLFARRALLGADGVPHHAVLARPALDAPRIKV